MKKRFFIMVNVGLKAKARLGYVKLYNGNVGMEKYWMDCQRWYEKYS